MRKSIIKIIEDVKKILEKEGELSIRRLSIKTKSQWRTIEKALETMKSLGAVKERLNNETERVERLFSLKK